MNQTKGNQFRIVLVGVLMVAIGVALPLIGFALPTPLSTTEAIPYSPYIPEGYYSRGEIDYVNPETGLYYLVVMPKATRNVNYDRIVESASLTFAEPAITVDVPFKTKVPSSGAIEWSQFWLETDVTGDGLEFDKNYTITWAVSDRWDGEDSVSDWLMFKQSTDEAEPDEVIPSEPQVSVLASFNYVTFAGVAVVVAGLYLGRNKR